MLHHTNQQVHQPSGETSNPPSEMSKKKSATRFSWCLFNKPKQPTSREKKRLLQTSEISAFLFIANTFENKELQGSKMSFWEWMKMLEVPQLHHLRS